MEQLQSYVSGGWVSGARVMSTLVNPATEEPLAETSTEGIDFALALDFARTRGGPALRSLTFRQRAEMLKAMSRAIHQHRDALIEVAMTNGGNTRGDAKFDIDGASGTLAYYADLGASLGDARVLSDGEAVQLGRSPRFFGQHVLVPRPGVALHINAFNFPAWGLAEKAACALLAGMPIISKPATSTALLAHRIARLMVEANALPEGAFSFVAGAPGNLLSHLNGEDVLAFTGSSDTAAALKALPNVVQRNVRVNLEADSLNCAILGPDVEADSETYQMFVRDVVRDITQKAGQKCTAIRRVFVPGPILERVQQDLVEKLNEVRIGDPAREDVTMGPLATATQLRDVLAGIKRFADDGRIVVGSAPFERLGVVAGKGYFVPPTLFVCDSPQSARHVHAHEVFGPVATLMAFAATRDAIAWIRKGGGGLVSSVYSDNRDFASEMLFGIAPHHGRLVLGSAKIADQTPGPGTVLPQSIHGGPGRAGGGEELGGLRGLGLYSQRVALQGARVMLEALLR